MVQMVNNILKITLGIKITQVFNNTYVLMLTIILIIITKSHYQNNMYIDKRVKKHQNKL